MFHEMTKHIEIDRHFVRKMLLSKKICTKLIGSNDQLAYVLTKFLDPQIDIYLFQTWNIQFIYSNLRRSVTISIKQR